MKRNFKTEIFLKTRIDYYLMTKIINFSTLGIAKKENNFIKIYCEMYESLSTTGLARDNLARPGSEMQGGKQCGIQERPLPCLLKSSLHYVTLSMSQNSLVTSDSELFCPIFQ